MLFEIGEYVSYGNSGICVITDITTMQNASLSCEKEYYILQPISNNAGKVFTPVDNDKVFMRRLLTKEEVNQLINDIPEIEVISETNPRELDVEYKRRIRTGDCHMWVSIIKTIYRKKADRELIGKKLTSSDERCLRDVTSRLYNEISFIMEKDIDEVSSYMIDAINTSIHTV